MNLLCEGALADRGERVSPRLFSAIVCLFAISFGLAAAGPGSAFANSAEHQGSHWLSSEAPLPTTASATNPSVAIYAIRCLSTQSCVAVGGFSDVNDNGQGLIETLAGGTWSPTEAPLPANASTDTTAFLDAIACPAPGSCTAIGQYRDSNGDIQGVIEAHSGGKWVPTEAPAPANSRPTFPSTNLGTVACPATLVCVITGAYIDANGRDQTLVDTLNEGTWTPTELPVPLEVPAITAVGITRLICPTTHSCIALGGYIENGSNEGLIETWSGRKWIPKGLPLPTNAAASNLQSFFYGLSCRTVHSCVAVGTYTDANGDVQGVVETLSRRTWNAVEAPAPADSVTTRSALSIYALACPSKVRCIGAGKYVDKSGHQGLFETSAKGAWTPSEAPIPANASTTYENGVLDLLACPAVRSCVALGQYTPTAGSGILIEMMSKRAWTASEAPLPGTAAPAFASPELDALACPSVRVCVAAGQYADTSDHTQGLIEVMGS